MLKFFSVLASIALTLLLFFICFSLFQLIFKLYTFHIRLSYLKIFLVWAFIDRNFSSSNFNYFNISDAGRNWGNIYIWRFLVRSFMKVQFHLSFWSSNSWPSNVGHFLAIFGWLINFISCFRYVQKIKLCICFRPVSVFIYEKFNSNSM